MVTDVFTSRITLGSFELFTSQLRVSLRILHLSFILLTLLLKVGVHDCYSFWSPERRSYHGKPLFLAQRGTIRQRFA